MLQEFPPGRSPELPSSGTAEVLQIDALRVYLAHVAYISRRANIVGGSTPAILRSICSILLNLAWKAAVAFKFDLFN